MAPLTTRFTEHAKIQYPIICGAMYPCTSPELVAAVSEAGGIGIIQPMSVVYVRGYDFREALKYIRRMTSKPYGLNIILVPGYEDILRVWLDIALEEGCRFFITALGKPTWVEKKVHACGGIIYHDVINRDHALKAIDAGVDGLICVNNRAGGHCGDKSESELYNELSDLGVPLICAGGIGDEKGFVSALQMGYEGIQMGTRFIATVECAETDAYKQAILKAEEKDIVLSNRGDGVPGAVILTPALANKGLNFGPFISWLMRNRWTKKHVRTWASRAFKKKGLHEDNGRDRLYSAGKSVASITKIEHVKDIVERFVTAAEAVKLSQN